MCYRCIPQANKTMQREAITSLPAYVAASHAFVICAPELPREDKKGDICNLETCASHAASIPRPLVIECASC